MCFSRSSATKEFYTMNGAVLELVNSFSDLGIIFNCKLDFRNHITPTVSKGACILGFIKRWAKDFSDSYVTNQFFIFFNTSTSLFLLPTSVYLSRSLITV